MGSRSHEYKFIEALKSFPNEKASFARLAAELGGDWTPQTVERRAREFDVDHDTPINVVKHGVQYFGCETGARPGLYKEVRRGIEKCWGMDNAMRHIVVEHTSRTSERGRGKWTQPDLVARVRRRADAVPEVVFLAIEVERAGGFDIQSIYQAYEFGRGADSSWVFYEGPACTGPKWQQIKVAARDLGVGVVHARRATQPSKWTTEIDAKLRQRTAQQQRDFLRRSGLNSASFERSVAAGGYAARAS